MHIEWQPIVELTSGMLLGSGLWLDPAARDGDLAYGMAHRQSGMFSQAWYTPAGLGVFTAWEGETTYTDEQPCVSFSAWVYIATGGGSPYAKLQRYANNTWGDWITDTVTGSHWFYDSFDTAGVIHESLSSQYSDGDLAHLRLQIVDDGIRPSTANVYRAYMVEAVASDAWSTFPTWTGGSGAAVHTVGDWNTIRTALFCLKWNNERPLLGSEFGLVSHAQPGYGNYQELLRWSFHYGGARALHIEGTVDDTDNSDGWIRVFLQDEQYPHGPTAATRLKTLATWNTDGLVAADLDLSGWTLGSRYCVAVGRNVGSNGGPTFNCSDVYIQDTLGVTRTGTVGTFSHGDITTYGTMRILTNDLAQMNPDSTGGSPAYSEHEFASFRGHNMGVYEETGTITDLGHMTARKWRMTHTYDYLRWRGAGKVYSADGVNTYTLSDTTTTGGAQTLELKALSWLAKGDRYWVADEGSSEMLTCYEDWEG